MGGEFCTKQATVIYYILRLGCIIKMYTLYCPNDVITLHMTPGGAIAMTDGTRRDNRTPPSYQAAYLWDGPLWQGDGFLDFDKSTAVGDNSGATANMGGRSAPRSS